MPFHQWWIEFDNIPNHTDLETFANCLDQNMQEYNTYYKDLIEGKVLKELEIVALRKDSFKNYMKKKGKLGGQNKLPRLSNDRKIAEEIEEWKEKK